MCVHLLHLNLQGHEMEMHRPFLVITTNTVPFKMWNRNCLILISNISTIKLGEIFVRWEIEPRHASSPLSWNIDTDPNPKLCWPSRVVAREDNKYRDTQKILGLAYWLRSKRYALPAHCAFLMFWYPVDLHRFCVLSVHKELGGVRPHISWR